MGLCISRVKIIASDGHVNLNNDKVYLTLLQHLALAEDRYCVRFQKETMENRPVPVSRARSSIGGVGIEAILILRRRNMD